MAGIHADEVSSEDMFQSQMVRSGKTGGRTQKVMYLENCQSD